MTGKSVTILSTFLCSWKDGSQITYRNWNEGRDRYLRKPGKRCGFISSQTGLFTFFFVVVAGVVNWLLLAKGGYMFSIALKKYTFCITALLHSYGLCNYFYG